MNCKNYKYEIIDAFKLGKDLADYCEKRKIFQKDFFNQLGISSNTISNSVNNISQGKATRDGVNLDDYEYCSKYGMMQVSYLKSICMMSGLKYEDYVVKKKQIKKLNAITAAELLSEDNKSEINIYDKIDEFILAINTLGSIQAQNMEYLKEIKDGIDKLNDKWK